MNRLLFSGLLSITCLLPACAQKFSNPLSPSDWPDPTVWQGDDGLYYSFSTYGSALNDGCGSIARSEDMVHWDIVPNKVWSDWTATQIQAETKACWAPQVLKLKGKWLMYLTGYSSAHYSMIGVLSFNGAFPSEDGLTGPWEIQNILIDSRTNQIKDNIDPFVQEDPSTGKVWLFFGSTDGCYRVELTDDGLSLIDNPQYTHVAGLKVAQNPSRDKVFEGIYLYYRSPYWYCFVSSGNYDDASYSLKVGRSTSLTGTFVDKEGRAMTDGYAVTLLSTSDDQGDFWGPGHNAEIFTDASGRTFMYYHSHATISFNRSCRSLMLQQILWDKNGWPYFEGNAPKARENFPNLNNCSYSLSISAAEWATIYLPFTFEVPSDLLVYEVRVGEDNLLDLTQVTRALANRPYLVNAVPGTYQLSGHRADAVDGLGCGNLIGSHSAINVEQGMYVLQNQNGVVAFYRVGEQGITMPGDKAYLQIPQQTKSPATLSIGSQTATIEQVKSDSNTSGNYRLYSINGQSRHTGHISRSMLVQYSEGSTRKIITH